jgi:hypothetical protein
LKGWIILLDPWNLIDTLPFECASPNPQQI